MLFVSLVSFCVCGGSIAVVDAEALMHFVSSKLVFAKTMKETWQKEVSIGVKCQDDDAVLRFGWREKIIESN